MLTLWYTTSSDGRGTRLGLMIDGAFALSRAQSVHGVLRRLLRGWSILYIDTNNSRLHDSSTLQYAPRLCRLIMIRIQHVDVSLGHVQ